jgi:D-3-phosphoglycerate dehydrogenase
MNILFLPSPQRAASQVWEEEIVASLGDLQVMRIYDYARPFAAQFKDIDAVIDWGGSVVTHEILDAAKSVRLWQSLMTGLDNFDLDYCREKWIPVANCPGSSSAGALAECAMMLILMLARKYPAAQQNLRKGVLYEPMGKELAGLELGLVGFGASAKELARRATSFGLRVSAIDVRDVSAVEAEAFGLGFIGKLDALDRIVATSDILSLHIPLDKETHHIVNARRLSLMKPGAILINVARGPLVDEGALENVLAEGRLAGAGLDVFAQEPPDLRSSLFSLPNVITTPHIAGATDGTLRRRVRMAVENLNRIAAGLEPLYRVA